MEVSVKFVNAKSDAVPRGGPTGPGIQIHGLSQPEWAVVLWFHLDIEHTDDKSPYVCTGFELVPVDRSGREITPDVLRHVEGNWDRYLTIAHQVLDWDPDKFKQRVGELQRLRRRGRRGMDKDFYRGIAEEYRGLLERGERPTTGIARAHGVGRSTASRWVRDARDRGLLGEALPRRAGEQPKEDR